MLSLSWSPPGLAKHRKCAIAILTSNLALSIWAPDAKPSSALSWKRRLVLNRTLDDFLQESEDLQDMDHDESLEMLKRSQRIRSFAWCPPLRFSSTSDQHSSSPADIWGHSLIAVSNDCNQVILVEITSPYQQISTNENNWESSILAHFSTAHFDKDDLPKLAWTYEDYLRKRDYASYLAWSPWLNVDDGSLQSFVAYATHTKIALRRIETSSGPHNLICDETDIYSDNSISSPIVGQLRWFPKTSTDGNLFLIATFGDHIRCYQVPISDPQDVKINLCFREEWDEISGLTFSNSIEGEMLYYSNFISTPKVTNAVQITPSPHPLDGSIPQLQEKLKELMQKFSDAHNLDGRVRTKVWGMASPPLGDLIATVFSFHPSDLPEYLISAEQESNLTIANADRGNDPALRLPINGGLEDLENISSENLVFILLHWLSRHKNISREDESLFQDLYEELSNTLAVASDQADRELPPTHERVEDISVSFAVKSLRNSLYESTEARSRICQHLSSLLAHSPLHSLKNDAVLRALTFTVLGLPRDLLKGGSVTKKIIRNYNMILSRVQPTAVEKLGNGLSFEEEGHEHCTICNSNSVISFQELDSARGACGHQFGKRSWNVCNFLLTNGC